MTDRPRPRVRPRFELRSSRSPDELTGAVREAIAADPMVEGLVLDHRVELVPPADDQRLWSPQLTVDLDSRDDGGSALRCRFGPHPHVWTMYLALHAVGALATLGAAIYGLSQHLAGETPWALWALPAAPLMAGLVWALAFVGQSAGAEQMYRLRAFLETAAQAESARDSDDAGP